MILILFRLGFFFLLFCLLLFVSFSTFFPFFSHYLSLSCVGQNSTGAHLDAPTALAWGVHR